MAFSRQIERARRDPSPAVRRFLDLMRPVDDARLAAMAGESAAVTRRNFGRTMRLFAPIYLSNECINSCSYCGFSRENAILRVTLEIDQIVAEARHLMGEGFRNILLVAGEHPKFVSNGYLERTVRALAPLVPSLSLEVGPMETAEYLPLVAAGAEGLVVYQETYHPETYAAMHTTGPKKDYAWRLDCPERAYAAGFRRIGIGALFGLWDWRDEALSLASHLDHLLKTCWKAQITVSLPRLRPAAGDFQPTHPLPDRDLIQFICALRLTFPHVGIVLSTRESAALRDAIAPIGITLMSAGSHTEPGGYTGQGNDRIHLTVRGRMVETDGGGSGATGQFEIADNRTADDVASRLRAMGLDPIWKDWDAAILGATA